MTNLEARYLSGLISESQYREEKHEADNYMFFANLKTIKERVDAMLAMDVGRVDAMLSDGHDWANDHISTSKDDVEEVYNWLSGQMGRKSGKA